MSQEKMARMSRFTPSGHPYFIMNEPGNLSDYFQDPFASKGGWTPKISKRIGWEK